MYGVGVSDPKTKPIPLEELIAQLQALLAVDGIERARAAKLAGNLGYVARSSVAAAGDEGIWQAKRRGMSYKDIAEAMDYSDIGPVGRAISRHNRRLRGEL